MLASIIVVNYNGKYFLADCLTAIEAQTVGPWEVILVDNGSRDGSIEFIRERFPWVRLFEAGRNLGFARGNNVGMRLAKSDNIVLLNNDTVVEPGWLEGLIAELNMDERIGAVGSKIMLKNEPGVINSVGLNLYQDGRAGDRGYEETDHGQYDVATDVFGLCGASMLLRRRMLDDVGAFDEQFFMYFEDLDLAWRARLRGWRFRYAPRSVVHHVHCGTSGEWSPFFLYHNEKNRVYVSLKNASAKRAIKAIAVIHAKAVRQIRRWVAGQGSSKLVFAYARALTAVYLHTPLMLWRRWSIRGSRRLVADAAIQTLIGPPPQVDHVRSAAA